ncbi:MAG: hypothetical protein JO258_20440 [Alphaproteobacteria bacterium]|nr:hypothetical protein [Alphaproteobacteria bacterium]
MIFVLMEFAAAVGLMVASPSPTWRDTSLWLVILSGFWIVVVAVGSFAAGGYLAGRVRSTWRATPDEVEFRDGTHGLITWAIGVALGAILLTLTATTYAATNTASPPQDTAGAPRFLAYEIDRLFRSDRRPEAGTPEARAEAARILMKGLGRQDLPADDRTHLARLTTAVAGVAQGDADQRVTQVLSQARNAASQARRSAVILGFCLAAGLAAGAAAAWMAAGVGGKHRDGEFAPPLRWRTTTVRTT